MSEGRRYSDEEVRAILERALRHDASKDGVAHDELVAAAAEVGVSREALERAAREIDAGRGEREAREAILADRRRGLVAHLYAFAGVNGFLILLNLLVSPSFYWFLFPLLGWGLGVFFHVRAALSRDVSERELARHLERQERRRRRAEKKLAAERRAADRRARKERLERGAAELGAAVEEGVGVLLSVVADEIRRKAEQASDAPPAPRSDVRVDVGPRSAASAKRDAGSPVRDAGSPVRDAGSPVRDALAEEEALAEREAELAERAKTRR